VAAVVVVEVEVQVVAQPLAVQVVAQPLAVQVVELGSRPRPATGVLRQAQCQTNVPQPLQMIETSSRGEFGAALVVKTSVPQPLLIIEVSRPLLRH
jgi:hypothetical protein